MTARLVRISLLVLVIAALAIVPFAGAQEVLESPFYATDGPYAVGMLELEAETPLHSTRMLVWYPALYPEGEEYVSGHPLTDMLPDVSGAPYPLVIFEVGWGADVFDARWIGAHLASYGFVVTVKDPIDSVEGAYNASDNKLFIRLQEVSWQIDYADSLTTAGGSLEGVLDMDRIAVAGHSLGGYTALMAGGARIDWDFFPIWCGDHYEDSFSAGLAWNFCDWDVEYVRSSVLAPLAGIDPAQTGLWPSWGDARVDAIVSLCPPYWMIIGPNGIGSLSVPMLLMGAEADRFVPPSWDLFYENAGSARKALVLFEGDNHEFHRARGANPPHPNELSRHFVTAFLLSVLKGDTDATAALAPDAVAFPGITYEATGF